MPPRTAHAVFRFGLGRHGAEALPDDPEPWLAAQLDGPDPALALLGARLAQCLTALRDDFRRKTDGLRESRAILQAEAAQALDYAATTDTPFRERLVWFWANHFTVSLRRGGVVALAHAYLREAIRPHVTGRFEAMLGAAIRHPAMLLYLDNAQSVGLDCRAGKRAKRGLNENLARECLELHTVTPASGYTQADVTAFAKGVLVPHLGLDAAALDRVFPESRTVPPMAGLLRA